MLTMLLNAGDAAVTFTLPDAANVRWSRTLDTAEQRVDVAGGQTYPLAARSLAVFSGQRA